MKNYWLYLEPYTFLFSKNGHSVLYNTISNQGRKFKNTGKLEAIVAQLSNNDSMYCVNVAEDDLRDSNLHDFIGYTRDSYSGDLLESSDGGRKPVIFAPRFKISKTIEQLQETEYKLTSDDILSHFNELSIYIGGDKPTSRLINVPVYKQFDYCRDLENQQMPLSSIMHFIFQVEHTPLGVINILGGNIFTYPELTGLFETLKHGRAIQIFNACYSDIPSNLIQYKFLSEEKVKLKVLVDFPVNIKLFEQALSLTKSLKIQTEWLFAITSTGEFDDAIQLIEGNSIENTLVKPVFTGSNLQLFIDNVYLDEEDILNTQLTRENIFARQVLNTYDFGKLTLMANGDVYANPNHSPIGTVNERVTGMLLEEMCKNRSWRRVRNQEPCTKCIYQWLCPSPSNYEIALNKANLCSVLA